MKKDVFNIYWLEHPIGQFERHISDVGHSAGVWAPSEAKEVATILDAFNRHLQAIAGKRSLDTVIPVTYRKLGGKSRLQYGLIESFGCKLLIDDPNEILISRIKPEAFVSLIQFHVGKVKYLPPGSQF